MTVRIQLEIGVGSAHGTTTAAITASDSSADMTIGGGIACQADEVIGSRDSQITLKL